MISLATVSVTESMCESTDSMGSSGHLNDRIAGDLDEDVSRGSDVDIPHINPEDSDVVRLLDEELMELDKLWTLQQRKVDALKRLRNQFLSGERYGLRLRLTSISAEVLPLKYVASCWYPSRRNLA